MPDRAFPLPRESRDEGNGRYSAKHADLRSDHRAGHGSVRSAGKEQNSAEKHPHDHGWRSEPIDPRSHRTIPRHSQCNRLATAVRAVSPIGENNRPACCRGIGLCVPGNNLRCVDPRLLAVDPHHGDTSVHRLCQRGNDDRAPGNADLARAGTRTVIDRNRRRCRSVASVLSGKHHALIAGQDLLRCALRECYEGTQSKCHSHIQRHPYVDHRVTPLAGENGL